MSGARREAEERRFPRPLYWDRLVGRAGAVAVHYADHAELSGLTCYDGSHLDSRSAAAFSRGFATVLKEKLRAGPTPASAYTRLSRGLSGEVGP